MAIVILNLVIKEEELNKALANSEKEKFEKEMTKIVDKFENEFG